MFVQIEIFKKSSEIHTYIYQKEEKVSRNIQFANKVEIRKISPNSSFKGYDALEQCQKRREREREN